jgi:hypothetical protein
MSKVPRYVGQIVVYALIALGLGYFSNRPIYHPYPADKAQIKVSFAHGGDRIRACRRLTPAEKAARPANMRLPMDCPRERVPLFLVVKLDDRIVIEKTLQPSGLYRDGPAMTYETLVVAPGAHRLTLLLRNSRRTQGFDFRRSDDINLAAGDSLAVDFRAETGGFQLFNQGNGS